MTEAQVATYEKSGFKSGGNAQPFESVSWQAGAETDLHEHMETISHDLVVRHLCRENKCESAVFVATGYFKGPALKVWKEAVRVTRAAQAPRPPNLPPQSPASSQLTEAALAHCDDQPTTNPRPTHDNARHRQAHDRALDTHNDDCVLS